jgi:Zn-dependent protease
VVTTIVGTRCRGCAPQTGQHSKAAGAAAPLFGVLNGVALRVAALAIALVACAGAIGYSWLEGDRDRFTIRVVVYGGLVVSLVLHEFSHSLVAYVGGDREIRERGFLTLNPVKFMDPVYSLAIPILFTMMGGIPIMGGRTLIDRHALRSAWWSTAVSLAGPGANVLVAVGIAALFRLGLVDEFTPLAGGLAYLAVLQVSLALFNLIPVPPLDGFGAISGHMSAEAQWRARSLGRIGYFVVLLAFWQFAPLNEFFWGQVYDVADGLHIPWFAQALGYWGARFR